MCSLEGERAPAARDGIDLSHERALIDLRLAPPLAQAAALVRLVALQSSLITDLRNARRPAEAELTELRRRIERLEAAAGGAEALDLITWPGQPVG